MYTKEAMVVSSFIVKCEKIQLKFDEGTPQFTLLKNRIRALKIVQSLLVDGASVNSYTKDELIEALPPITSIISKCEKAQQKFVNGTAQYARFENILKAMRVAQSLITKEISEV